MSLEKNGIYELGPFRLDTAQRVLLRDEEIVGLTPKAIELLVVLVENQGQVVAKEALIKAVWPDTFVEESNLASGISVLRKTLGEGYIETLPKRGYRFTGAAPVPRQVVTPPPSRSQASRIVAGGLVATALAVAGLLAWKPVTRPTVTSVVVLPFANLSPNPEDEFLGQAMTEELIDALAGIEDLHVVARSSAYRYQGKAIDFHEIGKTLGVDGVIEGTIRRDHSRVRVTVHLNGVPEGYQFWSKTFEREDAGLFAIQDEISREVVGSLRGGNSTPLRRRFQQGTPDLQAYNAYVRGEYLRQRFGASMDESERLLLQAAALDPSFAKPWAGLANLYHLWAYRAVKPVGEMYPKALNAAQHALKLDPSMAEAHAMLATIHLFYERDWVASKREFEQAVKLDPDDAETHHNFSHYWVSVGNFEQAHSESVKAMASDPLNVSIAAHQAFELEERGLYAEAAAAAEHALRLDPRHAGSYGYLEVAYNRWGKLRDAIATRRRAGLNDPPLDVLEHTLAKEGPSGYWRALAEAEERRYRRAPGSEMRLARRYAFVGDVERTVYWVKKGIENRDPQVVYLKHEPTYAKMRSDPRFAALIKGAGIP